MTKSNIVAAVAFYCTILVDTWGINGLLRTSGTQQDHHYWVGSYRPASQPPNPTFTVVDPFNVYTEHDV